MKNCKLLVLALTGDCNFACRYCYAAEMRCEMSVIMVMKTAIPAETRIGKVIPARF